MLLLLLLLVVDAKLRFLGCIGLEDQLQVKDANIMFCHALCLFTHFVFSRTLSFHAPLSLFVTQSLLSSRFCLRFAHEYHISFLICLSLFALRQLVPESIADFAPESHFFFHFVSHFSLQQLVPESIADFLRAGVRVWMITGDKLETAKNIGLACNLIDPDMAPRIRPGMSVDETIESVRNSRLLEVTGQWRAQLDDDRALGEFMFYRRHAFISSQFIHSLSAPITLHSLIIEEKTY
jgi:hypothetical protein